MACGPLLGALLAFRVLRHSPNVVHAVHAKAFDLGALLVVWRNRPAMLAIWAYVFHAWEVLGLWAWLPAYLAIAAGGGSVSVQAASVGIVFTALTYLVAAAGSIVGGALSDRWGRTAIILLMASSSLACSFLFGWLLAAPFGLLVVVAVVYNFTAVADSSIHSTALSELVPPRYIGAAYSLRSVLGFGAGAVSPWVLGLVLDWGRAAQSPIIAWGFAWGALGVGALLGPWVTWKLRQMPEARQLAHGKR